MNPYFQEPRPPYIEFEQRSLQRFHPSPPVGDGTPFYEMRDYIIITPAGSKDKLEQEVEPYLKNLDKLVKDGMFPGKWLADYKAAYEQWKEGNNLDVNGTPLRNWPAITSGEVKALISANVRTVEDLAAANESALGRIGMGARSLQQRARDWITAQQGTAPLVQQLDALRKANENMQKKFELLTTQNAALTAQVAAMASPVKRVHVPEQVPNAFVSKPKVDPAKADEQLIDEEFNS